MQILRIANQLVLAISGLVFTPLDNSISTRGEFALLASFIIIILLYKK